MKLQFKNITSYAAALVCGAGLLACTNLSELEDRVDSLDNRITAIENQISTLQDNINAIKALFEGQIFITEISTNDTEDEIYITMSDGNTYTITQGQIGNTPQIAVDDEGYWIVNYGDGYQRITTTVGDEELEVTSVPQFRVNDEGYWEISTDGGKSWETVTYTDGTTPVPAVGDGGDFFQDISYDEETGELSITLSDGNTYTFTVATDFVCQIVTDEDPVQFSPGSKRTFDVTMRGVQTVYIVKPDGWNVSLEGEDAADPDTEITATLTVEAPANAAAGVNTKISADSDNDIVLHAVAAASDRSIFAKMTVELNITTVPEVTIETGEVTDASITYTVTPNEMATSWKYIHQLASADAPTAESDGWTDGTETTLTFSDLEAVTTYTLYVLPVGESGNGEIVSATATTEETPIDNYYEAFMAGADIVIGGTVYNKSQFDETAIKQCIEGSIKLSSSNNGQILFIYPECKIEELGNMTNAIIIGNSPDSRPTITINNSRYLVPSLGEQSRLILKNINIVPGSSLKNYMFTVNQNYATHGAFGELVFDNCDITMFDGNFYSISGARYLDRFVMENCRIKTYADAGNRFVIHTANQENVFSEIIFRNNVFYCESGITLSFRLLSGSADTNNKTTAESITVENNTFVNAAPTNSSMIIASTIGEATFKNNLMFYNQTISTVGDNLTILFGTAEDNAGYPATTDCTDNIVYQGSNTKGYNMFYSSGYTPASGQAENPEIITDDPFAGGTFKLETGTFIPNSTYSSYGAQQ